MAILGTVPAVASRCLFIIWLFIGIPGALAAPPFAPAILFDTDVLMDAGFAESARRGATTFTEISGVEVTVFTPSAVARRAGRADHRTIVRMALDGGHSPVVGIGYGFTETFAEQAPANPETRFILVDSVVSGSNVQSIVFREEQGSFLVGALGALATKTGTIGFVGGQDNTLIRGFACGYYQGAHHANPGVRIISAMIGHDVWAYEKPREGKTLARRMIGAGADVIYHAAGLSGNGVIEAAAEAGVLAIGVDSNQNAMAPGHVLTSMLKRLDVAVYLALQDVSEGRWRPDILRLGLAEGAIGWSLDQHNIGLVSQGMQDHLENRAFEIMTDRIRVAVYNETEGCPLFGSVNVEDWGVVNE